MLKNEVTDFLGVIDKHITKHLPAPASENKFELRIIGKCALLLAGLFDSVGTIDIDALRAEGETPSVAHQSIIENLGKDFGKSKLMVNGYYLEFVNSNIVFLPRRPRWIPVDETYSNLTVRYLEPHDNIASKLFSAFTHPQRKKDKNDIVEALDKKIVDFQSVLKVADDIFDLHSMDARSDRFSEVYNYITGELMAKYGKANLKYIPDDDLR